MKATHKLTGEVMNFNVSAVFLDVSAVLPEWEGLRQYNCPCVVVPLHWAVAAKWEIVNGEPRIVKVKINGQWMLVYGHSTMNRVGERREPSRYPDTRVMKKLSSVELSLFLADVAKKLARRLMVCQFGEYVYPLFWDDSRIIPGSEIYSSIEEWIEKHPEVDLGYYNADKLRYKRFHTDGKCIY